MRDELPFSCHFVKLAPAACHVKVLKIGWTQWGQIHFEVEHISILCVLLQLHMIFCLLLIVWLEWKV